MKHARFFRIALILSLFLSITTFISPASAQVGVVAAVEIDLTLRVGPGTEWRQLGIMPAGTNVRLDGRDSSGLWVRGITQNGEVGWMAARYLGIGEDAVFALPVIEREAPISVEAPPPGAVPASAPSAPAQEEAAPAPAPIEGGLTATATANVNMRAGPSTEYNRVGGLASGETLNIDGRDPFVNWVRGVNAEGVVGWVSANFISLGYNEIAALPVVEVGSPFGLAVPQGAAAQEENASAAPAAPVPPPIVSNAPVTGFSYGGHVQGLDEVSVNYMRIAGMTWAKYQVRYTQGDDPNAVAGLINDTHAKGFRILLGVVGLPSQLNNGGYYDAYANYVAGLAALGADAIEIWNEPNIDREWPTGQIDPAMYTSLLATSYNAIKSVNPNTLVITGAPAPTGFFGGCSPNGCDDNVYVAGMAAAGAANYADCLGVHYNEGIVPPTQNFGDPRSEFYTRYYNGMVNTYYNAFGGRLPLCFTELGYLTPEGFPPLPGGFAWAQNVTVAQQAAWLDQVMSLARNSGRVRLVIVWNVNFTRYDSDPMAGYAIIRPDGNCPACFALGN